MEVWECGGVKVWECGGVKVWECGGVGVWGVKTWGCDGRSPIHPHLHTPTRFPGAVGRPLRSLEFVWAWSSSVCRSIGVSTTGSREMKEAELRGII
jgi:hypothetical protein